MTDINSVVVLGRLTRDIDSSKDFMSLDKGGRLNISIAVNRSHKKDDQWCDDVSYFDVTIWGKTAEKLATILHKGMQVSVQGYLKQDRWVKDGEKKSRVVIIADYVQLCGSKSDDKQELNSRSETKEPPKDNFGDDIPF